MQENQNLKESINYLQQQLTLTKGYTPRRDDIEHIAGNLLKTYNSDYKKDTLVKNLSRLYEYIRSSEQIDGKEVTEAATAIAKGILNQSKQIDTEMVDKYKIVLQDLKSTSIKFAEPQRSELDAVGGYNAFRRKYFGKLRLGNDGVDVDTAYQEFSGKYPELFPDEIVNTADQLLQMANVIDSLRPRISNPYQADIDEMSYIVGQQIFDNYFDVRNLPPTKADRMAAEADRVKREYSKRMDKYRSDLKERYQKSFKEVQQQAAQELQEVKTQYEKANIKDREKYKQRMNELRDYKNLKIRAEQQLYHNRLNERRERTAAAQTKKQIVKEVMELKTWLVNPTDKKHVPEALRKPLAEFLGCIDFSSNRLNADGNETMRTRTWNQLKDIYNSILHNGGILETDQESFYLDVDPDLLERMIDLNDQVKNIDKLENLSYLELENVKKVVQAMKHSIQEVDKLRANDKFQSLAKCAVKSLEEMKIRKDKLQFAGNIGNVDRLMRNDMLDSYTMFNRIGTAAESIYCGLREGLDKKINNTKMAQDYIQNVAETQGVTKKEIREWSGKRAKSRTFSVEGGEIKLTPAQIMSLYVLNKRIQAQKHIYNQAGGIKAGANISSKQVKINGKGIVVAQIIEKSNKPVRVTTSDVNNIIDILTPKQKTIADSIVDFFSTKTAEWGNEVSLELYGYRKFMAPDYFPIVTDRNSIATKTENIENAITTLKNLGSTKSTVRGANTPVIIEDIFDVYTRQADQMGSYNAFVIALSDLQKYYNFNHMDIGNMKQELERTFGSDVHRYIMQLMKDINGIGGETKDFTETMIRNMKSSAVGYNLRTAIQQPTAYVRALAEINGKYLLKGLKLKTSESEWVMCKKYAPIAQWKDWGYFDVNTGRSMKSILLGAESLKEEMIESSMNLAGKGDEITWKRLWEAVKAETDEIHPELSAGTEAYYKQCGKRFSEIIDRTQVVDSVLHRSNLMKRKGLPQLYTSFMSEPTKSYNMLYRAWEDAYMSKSQDGKMNPELRRRALTVSGIWGLTGFTTALAASIVDAIRDDKDKELYEKYIQALSGNLLDNLNPLQMIPVVKDVMSIFNGYAVGRLDMQGFEQMSYAVNDLQKYISGESKYTFMGMAQQFIRPISSLSGVSAYNLTRDTTAVLNTMLDIFGIDALKYVSDKTTYRLTSSSNTGMYVKKALKAYLEGNKTLGDKIINDSLNAGIDTDKVDEKMKSLLKDDQRVVEAAEARRNGEFARYEELVNELTEEGISKEICVSVIRSQTKKNVDNDNFNENVKENEKKESGEKEEKKEVLLFENADLKYAFDAGNIKDCQRIADALFQEKRKAGKSETDSRSAIKSYLTGQYRKEFLAADIGRRKEIQRNLEKRKVGGKNLYDDQNFKDWIEAYQKDKKKK